MSAIWEDLERNEGMARATSTSRMKVPGGYLYREVVQVGSQVAVSTTFAPNPPKDEEELRRELGELKAALKEAEGRAKKFENRFSSMQNLKEEAQEECRNLASKLGDSQRRAERAEGQLGSATSRLHETEERSRKALKEIKNVRKMAQEVHDGREAMVRNLEEVKRQLHLMGEAAARAATERVGLKLERDEALEQVSEMEKEMRAFAARSGLAVTTDEEGRLSLQDKKEGALSAVGSLFRR